MYESPIDRIYEEIQTKIIEHEENQILQAVQNCGITVDKEELTRALMHDRQQYEKGYADAKAEMKWIPVSETVDIPEHEVLACDKYGAELIGFLFENDGQWMCECEEGIMYDVVAWMEKPEPYKGEADENNSRNTY